VSLDIAMAGGWPAAAPSVLVGPDGAGKDYLLWRTMAEAQATYGDDFCAAVYFTEFKLDKTYMKDICGFQIAMSEPELEELDRARHEHGMASLTPYQVDHYRRQIGTFAAIYGVSADHGFDQIFKFIKSNCCQIVAVNSIGFLQTEAKEEKDSYEEFAQQRNEAMLLSKALPQFAMYMNRPDEDGRPNETALILLNQVRAKDNANTGGSKRPQMERDKYKTAANAWALKHGKAIEIFVHNGGLIMDEAVKPPYPVGRKKQWEITKGKLGTHEGIRGEFDYIFHHGADVQSDLVNTAVKLGIVELSGSWLSYENGSKKFRTQGYPRALQILREDPELAKELRSRCFQEAQIVCRSE
jgi:RecA/RadA recombinase